MTAAQYVASHGITEPAEVTELLRLVHAAALATGTQWLDTPQGRFLVPTQDQADDAIARVKARRGEGVHGR